MNMQNNGEKTDGGIVVYFDKEQRRTTYIRYTGYWYLSDQYLGIGENTLLWCRNDVASKAGAKHFRRDYNLTAKYGTLPTSGHLREAIPLRCIQDGRIDTTNHKGSPLVPCRKRLGKRSLT